MSNSRFATLEDVIQDTTFPEVDLALRRGRHVDREDATWYAFVADAQEHLEVFYRRYGCELVAQTDGYFYLLPTGEQLSRRLLSASEMLVGQALTLLYLDPATVQSGGVVSREQLLTRLVGLIGDRNLAKTLEPRRKRFDDERLVHEIIRRRVAEAIRRLASLGFVELIDDEDLRLRSSLLRFAGPVRGLRDFETSLERLISKGEVVGPAASNGAEESPQEGPDSLTDEEEESSDRLDDDLEVDS